MENIIKSSLDCIVVSDSKGYITRVNKSFLNLLDVSEYEVLGQHIYTFSPVEKGSYESITGEQVEVDDAFLDEARERTSQLLSEGRISTWDTYLIRRDKMLVPVEENIDYLYNPRGNG